MNLVGCSSCKPLDLKVSMLTSYTQSIFVTAYWEKCSFPGNPLSQDILNIYQEPDGTRKLLNYMLDNLAGITATETHMLEKPLSCWLKLTHIISPQISPPRTTTPKTLDHFEGARPNGAHRYQSASLHWCVTQFNNGKANIKCLSQAVFTVMCYNVLCDKYATRQLYGYCPSWALNWEYRKKGIMEEITNCDADIISLQVV